MTTILILDRSGQVVGRVIEETETIEATTEEFEGVLRGFVEGGAPWMIGGCDEERGICWDGFVPVFPGDPRWPDALARGLRSAGYRFTSKAHLT